MKNPFIAGPPVSGENFYGRKKELDILKNRIQSTIANSLNDRYLVLYGRRASGKSSILQQLEVINPKDKCLFVKVRVTEAEEYRMFLEDILNSLFKCLEQTKSIWEKTFEKFKIFLSGIDGISYSGISIHWNTEKLGERQVKNTFDDIFPKLWEQIKQSTSYKALIVAIDEMDNLAGEDAKDFRHKYAFGLKDIGDKWQKSYQDIFIVVSCLSWIYDELIELQPSLDRFFEIMQINDFDENDIDDMFSKIFTKGIPQKSASQGYIKEIKKISGGVPYYIQAISKEAFELDQNNILDVDDYKASLPKTLKLLDGKIRVSMKNIKVQKHAIRTLRLLSASKRPQVKREDICKDIEDSFKKSSIYKVNEQYEFHEDEYSGPGQISNALTSLIHEGLIERVDRGFYKIIDRMTDLWINYNVGEYSLEESIKRSN